MHRRRQEVFLVAVEEVLVGLCRALAVARSLLALVQRPFLKGGQVRLPGPLHPTGARDLPSLARKPFRDLWETLEDEE